MHLPNMDMLNEFSANLEGDDPADAVDYREQKPAAKPHTPYLGKTEEKDLSNLAGADPVIFMYHRGNEHFKKGRYENALAAYQNALVLEPNHPEAHFKSGACLHMLEQYEAAVAEYDEHLALRPNDARVYYNKGNSLSALHRWEEANESYSRAVELDPSFADAYANRAFVLLEMGNTTEAQDDANHARDLNASVSIPKSLQ